MPASDPDRARPGKHRQLKLIIRKVLYLGAKNTNHAGNQEKDQRSFQPATVKAGPKEAMLQSMIPLWKSVSDWEMTRTWRTNIYW